MYTLTTLTTLTMKFTHTIDLKEYDELDYERKIDTQDIREDLSDIIDTIRLELKYYHDVTFMSAGINKTYYHPNSISLDKNNKICFNKNILFISSIYLATYEPCALCDEEDINIDIQFNESVSIGYCPYYVNAANKIKKFLKNIIKLKN